MDVFQNIVMIGAGNVATHLAFALQQKGFSINQVYSRSETSAKLLAQKLESPYTVEIRSLEQSADIYIIAVSDDAIGTVAEKLKFDNQVIVHTSGSVPMDVLKAGSKRTGVVYPLQTFSKSREIDFQNIPVCIEASSDELLAKLEKFISTISNDVRHVNSEQRRVLHLAAVFACNFPNFMYAIAEDIISDAGLNLDILRPLIKETADKVMSRSPLEAQTGPARRNDEASLHKHLDLLRRYPEYKDLYEMISQAIRKKYNSFDKLRKRPN